MSATAVARIVLLALAAAACGPAAGDPPAAIPEVTLAGAEPAVARHLGERRSAVRAAPGDGEAWGAYGEALHAHGHLAEAATSYERAAALGPRTARWEHLLGVVRLDTDPALAAAAFARALAADPAQRVSGRRRAQALALAGRWEEAEAAWRAEQAAGPLDAAALLDVARVLAQRGALDEALARLDEAERTASGSAPVAAERARLLARLGRMDEARAQAARASTGTPLVAVDPLEAQVRAGQQSASGLHARALEALAAGEVDAGLDAFARAHERAPDDVAILGGWASALLALGRLDDAAALFERAIARDARDAGLHVGLGVAHARAGRLEQAAAAFESACALDPADPAGWDNLGLVHERAGRPQEARAVYERAARQSRDPEHFARRLAAAGVPGVPVRPAPLDDPEEPAAAAGHARMLAALEDVRARTPDENPILGDRLARELRAALAAVPPGAPPDQLCLLERQLAEEELHLGNTARAIELFEAARGRLDALAPPMRHPITVQTLFLLGVAHLRSGEEANCLARHDARACLLPFEGGGRHEDGRGSRAARAVFADLRGRLAPDAPMTYAVRWLDNLAAMTLGEWPDALEEGWRLPPELFASDEPFPRFENVAGALGVDAFDLCGGAIADDFDGDGRIDLLSSTWDTGDVPKLFVNRASGFERADAGLDGLFGGLNLVHADVDDDGDADVYVTRGAWVAGDHPDSLLLNDGTGRFTDATFERGLAEPARPGQVAAFADVDLDGRLDLFVGAEHDPSRPRAAPCRLFVQGEDRAFTDVAARAGVENFAYTKGASWGDYDDDGDPDLYVSNLWSTNRLYRNDGDGTFTDVAPALRVEEPVSSFPCWWWDYDNDGALDLMVHAYMVPLGREPPDVWYAAADRLGAPHNADMPRLYRNDGRGGLTDVAEQVGLDRVTLPMGANYGDLDADGWLDMYLGTGYPGFEGVIPNVMLRNVEGRRFADVTTAGGFGHVQKGHGVAFADVDEDGDQDVFQQIGGFYPGDAFGNALFENPGFPGTHWLKVECVGTRTNRSAIGVRLVLELLPEEPAPGAPGAVPDAAPAGEPARRIVRWIGSGGSFGGNPLRAEIGLGRARRVARLEVRWPVSGTTQVLRDVPADTFVRVRELVEGYEIVDLTPRPLR